MHIQFRREDGSFVGTLNGLPYHFAEGDPLYPQAVDLGANAPLEPAPEAATVPPRRIGTPREFLGLFSDAEKLAFFDAARQSASLQVWWAEASTGDFSLDHPSVAEGLGELVNAGVLTSERHDAILAADFNG